MKVTHPWEGSQLCRLLETTSVNVSIYLPSRTIPSEPRLEKEHLNPRELRKSRQGLAKDRPNEIMAGIANNNPHSIAPAINHKTPDRSVSLSPKPNVYLTI